ncbi:Carboxyl-terminal protease [hydrothermal vent metagenome]|jgi:carboxyl-terminal processing protease|uniref:Carboxyl-terminal protease n=1 Tax=hydrothermal vent metagenome TaxID=652676 RepID=A0A161K6F1_9ZZZZ|nr:S41 family peptidase [Gammaproteobacteria bacterium]
MIVLCRALKRLLIGLAAAFCLGPLWVAHAGQAENAVQLPIEDLKIFAEIFGKIKSDYVEDIDDSQLLNNAIKGMLDGLDPHTVYLDPDSFREMNIDTHGEFGGLGLEVTMENGVIRIVAPIDDTPAHKAGLKSGDLIISMDGVQVKGLSLGESVSLMRGKPGSEIVLTIVRKDRPEPFEVTLKRAIIQLESVRAELLETGFGYVRVIQFQIGTATSLRQQLARLAREAGTALKGLVLDLRDNPGGVLDGAIQVSDTFLRDGLIVSTRGRAEDSEVTFSASPKDYLNDAPLVVLVNGGSASASEIVAGALQDHGRALILGTTTFGKGSVQTILPMLNGAALKLTTARYYTPNDRSIQATGITPDVVSQPAESSQTLDRDASRLRESDLAGHLENELEKDQNATVDTKTDPLLFSDLQVREALNILKGMVIARQQSL